MSGPYDQAQIIGQAAGRVGGQTGGQFVGQSGGQFVGQSGGQFVGQAGGQSVGHTVVTHTSIQRSAEGQSSQLATSSSRGERHRRQRNDTSSSSSLSDRAYKAGGGQAVTGSFQQFSAESQLSQGGVTGGSYAAAADSFGSVVSGQRRQGRYQKQVIRLPDQQGQVRQVRRRLPTPEPDTLERVYIQRTGNEIVEEITEIPTTPPPRIQERTVVEPAGPPQIIKRVIRVPPRSGGYQQQGGSFVSQANQSSGQLLSAGSYGNVQQASSGYQQYGGAAVAVAPSTGYSGYGTGAGASYGSVGGGYGGGYGSVGGGYGSVGGGYGSVGGGYGSVGGGYGSVGGGYGSVGGGYGSVGGGYGGGYGSVGGGFGSQALGPFPGIPATAQCFYV